MSGFFVHIAQQSININNLKGFKINYFNGKSSSQNTFCAVYAPNITHNYALNVTVDFLRQLC